MFAKNVTVGYVYDIAGLFAKIVTYKIRVFDLSQKTDSLTVFFVSHR